MIKKSFSMLNFTSRRLLSLHKISGIDWTKENKMLMEPFDYVYNLPCKQLNMIPSVFDHWLQIPKDKLDIIKYANWAWTSWNILLDDIQDNSAHRYGVPAANELFGVGLSINASNSALLLVEKKMIQLKHPLALDIFLKRFDEYIRGQGVDIYWREKNICPSEEAHIEMTKYKGGACFVFPVEVMQLFSSNKKDYLDLALNIGIYYELVDDYFNLFEPKSLSKLVDKKQDNFVPCSDITEGKITLPIIHASQFPDVASELADILKQRTSDPELRKRALSLLKKHGSDEYARDMIRKVDAEIRKEIDLLGGNPQLTDFLDELFSFQKENI